MLGTARQRREAKRESGSAGSREGRAYKMINRNSKNRVSRIWQTDPYRAMLNYAFWLLGRKQYSEEEMRLRMERRAKRVQVYDAGGLIKKVLTRIKELNYINDDKILENYFEYRLKTRPQGKYAFLIECARRGIDKEKAAAAWARARIDERALAQELLEKRSARLKKIDPKKRKQKLAQMLASRGFAPDTVFSALGDYYVN